MLAFTCRISKSDSFQYRLTQMCWWVVLTISVPWAALLLVMWSLWNDEKLLVKLQTKQYSILLQFTITSLKHSVLVKVMPKYIVFICKKKKMCFLCTKCNWVLDSYSFKYFFLFSVWLSPMTAESLQGCGIILNCEGVLYMRRCLESETLTH